ncbi:MAG TPA: hypothetical protein PKV71_20890, partial [Calditrichia bacterium]|nr:hypothetical protein [Calditrichia bacterium]
RPKDQKTKRPKDQKAKRPKDQKTNRPKDRKTKRPKDGKTIGKAEKRQSLIAGRWSLFAGRPSPQAITM